ncbi:MAG: hypothetical protein H6835_03690 [Planctomycetes bacterium]|nr:hypothetical protein [Planctomycetota bacterium]
MLTALFSLLPLLAQDPAPTIAHGDGVKIGEVTATSAVLWTRLTAHADALDRVDDWNADRPHWRMPGAVGEVRFVCWPAAHPDQRRETAWCAVDADSDFCHQQRLEELSPATRYEFEAQGRHDALRSTFAGSFTTAPTAAAEAALTFVVSTCQDFPRRDDKARGHRIYRSMLTVDPAFFLQTGDTPTPASRTKAGGCASCWRRCPGWW